MPVIDDQKQEQKQESKQSLVEPKKYHVMILNDDFSTFELVTELCVKFFSQTQEQADGTAWDVHTKGRGLAGIYTKDVAETKSVIANEFSQSNDQPLATVVVGDSD